MTLHCARHGANRVCRPGIVVAVIVMMVVGVPAMDARPADLTWGIGLGIRAGLRDTPALVLGLSVRIAGPDRFAASVRPVLLIAEHAELRAALTVDAMLGNQIIAYAGGGIAYNESGSGSIYPMATSGMELALLDWLGLTLNVNHLFRPGDGDTEFMASLNCSFGAASP